MSMNLLNANQRRRLGTHLRLLVSDLDTLEEATELHHEGPEFARVRDTLNDARRVAQAIQSRLALPSDQSPSLKRRVAAVAEVWAARVEDLRARRLGAYGTVHPDLEKSLDPRIEDLRRQLEQLADAATDLPELDR